MHFIQKPAYEKLVTFQPDKKLPVYNWFYYKEAFSRELVLQLLTELNLQESVLDPFCGIGSTLLACREKNILSTGFDVNPIALLASRVKTRNYAKTEVEVVKNELSEIKNAGFFKPGIEWRFELFPPERAFPKASFEEILFLKQKISEVSNEKVRDLFLLALVSVIPETSFVMKDGGVLKILKGKKRHVPPVKKAFLRKALRMLSDLEKHAIQGIEPFVEEGDARKMRLESESINAIITSPPYLNNIDYTKVYGLELSLLVGEQEVKKIRRQSIRSFLGAELHGETSSLVKELLEHYMQKSSVQGIPLIAEYYFEDLLHVLREFHRVMASEATCGFVVSNAVVAGASIEVDSIVARMAEELGFNVFVWVANTRIADVQGGKPVRESIVVMEK